MRRAVVGLVALLALTGCTASVSGRGAMAAPQLCPAAGQDAARVVACVADDLNRFWRARLGRTVGVDVTVDPAPAKVDRACRSFLALGTAFYCPADSRAYVTGASVVRTRAAFGDRLPYALAVVVAHEGGHRVQYVARQPGLELTGNAASLPQVSTPHRVNVSRISREGRSVCTGNALSRLASSPGGINVTPGNPRDARIATSIFSATAMRALKPSPEPRLTSS